MFEQILSLPQEKALYILKNIVKSNLSSLPAECVSKMFQMYSTAVAWAGMQKELLGLILQMLDYKSLLFVGGVSKYYHLQVWKPNNWKYVTVKRKGRNELCRQVFECSASSLRFVRSLHLENCRVTESAVVEFFASMPQLRSLSLIRITTTGPNLIEALIDSVPLLEILELEQYKEWKGFEEDTLEVMEQWNNVI
jgi:hypothetical protein